MSVGFGIRGVSSDVASALLLGFEQVTEGLFAWVSLWKKTGITPSL